MTRMILIRHGQSETNKEKAFTGQLDVHLSATGREQALVTAAYCAKRWPDLEAIYTSDLIRAVETALPLGEKLKVSLYQRKELREILVPSWQGKSFQEIEKQYPDESRLWFEDIGHFKGPDGESMQEAAQRVERELCRICETHPGRNVAAVTHATPIRALQTIWTGGTLEDMKKTAFTPNASITVALYTHGRFVLEEPGLCEHLKGMITNMPGRT